MVLAFAFDKAGNVIEVHDRRGDPIVRGIAA
jgi:YD repeat-containing protein